MHAAEAAVAHHENMVARARCRDDRLHQAREIIEANCFGVEWRERVLGVLVNVVGVVEYEICV